MNRLITAYVADTSACPKSGLDHKLLKAVC